jgi:hypothetical protein
MVYEKKEARKHLERERGSNNKIHKLNNNNNKNKKKNEKKAVP